MIGIAGACATLGGIAAQAETAAATDARGEIVVRAPNNPDAWLAVHNRERAEFGSPALRWNQQLADDAGRWARKLAREGRLKHSSLQQRGGRGENLWMGTRGYFGPSAMIKSFADEKQHFTPGTFPEVSSTGSWKDVGHYTQIVWHETREVGCAIAPGKEYEVLVCRYYPAGNVIGTAIAPGGKNRPSLASR